MRLDKFIAHAGYGTRKDVKRMIRKGLVQVNAHSVMQEALQIDEYHDEIKIANEIIKYQKWIYIMMNKPEGYVCAHRDPLDPCIFEFLEEIHTRNCFVVGRLDKDASGLLLISNDGVLAHHLLSPKHHVWKHYEITINIELTPDDIILLQSGTIILDHEVTLKAKIKHLKAKTYCFMIQEGKYHQIKRMIHAVKKEVISLKRIQIKNLSLDENLAQGEWRYLNKEEIAALHK